MQFESSLWKHHLNLFVSVCGACCWIVMVFRTFLLLRLVASMRALNQSMMHEANFFGAL